LLLCLFPGTLGMASQVFPAPGATMRAAAVSRFGIADEVLSCVPDFTKPIVKEGSGDMLVKVLALSLSPGDWRTIMGDADLFRTPKSWPYVPGGDVCGVVEAIDPACKDTKFSVGQTVVSTWEGTAWGGMAEYALVKPKFSAALPKGLSPEEGAALANSAGHALNGLRKAKVKPGDRVLVLGGSGGVGCSLLQILKALGASYVAATSTDAALCTSLGADRVINYNEQPWYAVSEFNKEKFDIVIDLAEGNSAWKRSSRVAKPAWRGGRHVTFVLHEWHIEIHSIRHILGFMLMPMLVRPLWSLLMGFVKPRYTAYIGGVSSEVLEEVLSLTSKGQHRAVIDPEGPFPFTTEGVRAAFRRLASRHAKGKVVVKIADA